MIYIADSQRINNIDQRSGAVVYVFKFLIVREISDVFAFGDCLKSVRYTKSYLKIMPWMKLGTKIDDVALKSLHVLYSLVFGNRLCLIA